MRSFRRQYKITVGGVVCEVIHITVVYHWYSRMAVELTTHETRKNAYVSHLGDLSCKYSTLSETHNIEFPTEATKKRKKKCNLATEGNNKSPNNFPHQKNRFVPKKKTFETKPLQLLRHITQESCNNHNIQHDKPQYFQTFWRNTYYIDSLSSWKKSSVGKCV